MWKLDLSQVITAEERAAEKRSGVVAAIKAECNRRILEIMSEHKQRNTLAAGLAAVTQIGPGTDTWPAALKQRHAAAMEQWAEIERLRSRSNEIEAMETIPADFVDDIYWAKP